ncbi:MAG: AMP-binding protein [Gammaproteobacteria bacterium]
MTACPLISNRSPDDILAWRPGGPVSVGSYLSQVRSMADRLPATRWIINLCEDRYHFAVLLGACALSGHVSLQPSSQSAQTLLQLQAAHPGAIAVTDVPDAALPVPAMPFPALDELPESADTVVPLIPADRTVAILFTSGSTGQPQPHAKTWGRLVANGQAEAHALGLFGRPHVLVGTVPVQHSYGFESTFLLALHGGCSFWSGKPFYPQDLADALAQLPRPRMVVTTPYHLASVMASDLSMPAVDLWLSATAPLGTDLAARVERATGAPVHEIYGSTESSQLATRRTGDGPAWTLMPGVQLEQQEGSTWASGGHVEGRVPLADIIEVLADGRFELHGRHADMVNLAGKRTPLAYLSHQLCAIEGVRDGAFFLPREDEEGRVGRLMAFAVAPGRDRQGLLAALRQRIDPIFMPRPLVLVDALPRNSTGKLTRLELERLYRERVPTRQADAG